jgi:hypothetical protein
MLTAVRMFSIQVPISEKSELYYLAWSSVTRGPDS